ncbi:nucleoside 2-deoxyribosyltransferase [Streptomyces sp. LP05-1]|uniref:Nucleoside 2-deoxyribosyltransferase n=1 Tax=Streptomyces pyxinae TaxID=2970734 RepID=A0ABT2CBP9_9ACTN|nr:nucleoside 2-deoxyribosyltransferase [Streptomyces sp. LP05-1]MCS0634820.1 nucleoside 2-deoxyribosyltransferase [Streptomyces sp. LP05-1]
MTTESTATTTTAPDPTATTTAATAPDPAAPAPAAGPVGARTLFLAGPFIQLLDPLTGRMPEAARTPFTELIAHFEALGVSVHNAHRREAWGAELMRPEVCTPLDRDEIRRADAFVALPGHPASPGTHIEIGWASAFGKPIVLLLERGREYTFLVRGLGTVATVEYVEYTVLADALPEVDRALRRAVARHREAAAPAA